MKSIIELVGIASIAVGAFLVYEPLALVIAGVGLVLFAQGGDS